MRIAVKPQQWLCRQIALECRLTHKKNPPFRAGFLFIGAARFELTTSCSQSRRSTKLSYAPRGGSFNFGPMLYPICAGTQLWDRKNVSGAHAAVDFPWGFSTHFAHVLISVYLSIGLVR